MVIRSTIVVFIITNLFSIYLLINAPKIQIAVIIPFDNNRMFSVDRVNPSIEYSIEKIRNKSLLPSWYEISVAYANSNCNGKDAPIEAFNFYMNKSVSVFLGPVCDYSLAPVARYAPYWHIPVISPGGFAHDFGENKSAPEAEFPTLTRIGVTFNSLANSVIQMMKYYHWYKLKVIYDGQGHNEVAPRFCFLAGASLIHHLKKGNNSNHDFYLYVPENHDISKLLLEEVGNSYTSDPKYSWSLSKVLPAIRYAIENVEKQNILPNHKMVINYKDSNCSETIGPLAAIDMFMNKSADVFIGPVCDYAIAPIARFSPHWNIPVLSAGALVQNFDNKKEYKLLTRVQGVYSDMAKFFVDTVVTFNWTRLGLIYHDNLDENKDNGKSNCFFRMEAIFYRLKNTFRFLPWYKALDEQLPLKYDIAEILQAASKNVRIVVLCASADSVREIMIKAHELNFDNGEYVFFNIDLFSSKNESERPWHRENDTIERNDKAKKAYEALMTVTLRKPTSNEYREFSDEVKRRAKTKYENFTYGEEEVNSFVGAFHDAVILYAIALNETLEANRSISNGTEITRRMWNRTFKGITGNVSIDTNGDRSADYSLLDMNPTTGKFETQFCIDTDLAAHYATASLGLCSLQLDSTYSRVVANYFGNSKKYEPVPGKNIHWAGGKDRPPADTPKCGFDGSKCPPEKPFPEYAIGIIVLGTLLVIVLIASFFIYRRIKLEAELAEMNWRVKWEDIMFGAMEGDRKKRQGSNLSLARTEDGSVEGQTLIARSRSSLSSKDWCKCGQCEEPDHVRRVCCRHIDKLDDRLDGERCITSSKDFQDVVLNKQVLLTVFIHVMLARRQRGVAPHDLTPYKCRLMAARQFLCWVHSGESLKKEIKWSIPTCVTRAIRLMFPDVGAEVTSGDDAGSLSLDEMISIENINHTSV